MMRHFGILSAGVLALTLGACSSTSVEVSSVPPAPVAATPLGQGVWANQLAMMTASEREDFHALPDAAARTAFLERRGIDVRMEMAQRLSPGMSRDEVLAALEGQYDLIRRTDENDRLYLAKFNGNGRTNFFCTFSTDGETTGLSGWGSYTDAEEQQLARVHKLEARLRDRLRFVLRTGMGQGEITGSAEAARKLRESFKANVEENRSRSDYGYNAAVNGWSPSYADFATEADALVTEQMVERYTVTERRPDHIRSEGDFEYWYHRIPVDGSDTFIVLEYRFQSKRLKSWYVYHTDFLPFQ